MSTRDRFRALAEENVEIFRAGRFTTYDGTGHEIGPALAAAVAGTIEVLAPPAGGLSEAETRVTLAREDTLLGADRLRADGSDLLLLNFASARSPGGGYLRGGNAQEESLCRATALYPWLAAQPAFYERNRDWPDEVYADALLYTPGVPVIRETYGHLRADWCTAAVVTAPAPNRRALLARPDGRRQMAVADAALARRAALILSTARAQGHWHLVLGAWGCGVFGNLPEQVAALFAGALASAFAGAFERVHSAIPGGTDDPNAAAFALYAEEVA